MGKQLFLLLAFLFSALLVYSQFLQDRVTGKYYFDVKYTDVKGSPFLYDDWRPSLITYANGLQLKNVKLKFNLVSNKPLFLRNDSAFEFLNAVWEFVIYNPAGDSVIYRNGFEAAGNISPDAYLEIMEDGKLSLLRYRPKTITYTKGFSTAVTTAEFTFKPPVLYLFDDKILIRLKHNDEAVLKDTMKKDWVLVSDYIKLKKLNLKKDSDVLSAVRYFNSL